LVGIFYNAILTRHLVISIHKKGFRSKVFHSTKSKYNLPGGCYCLTFYVRYNQSAVSERQA